MKHRITYIKKINRKIITIKRKNKKRNENIITNIKRKYRKENNNET